MEERGPRYSHQGGVVFSKDKLSTPITLKDMFRFVMLAALAAGSMWAQGIGFGVKGGVPVADAFEGVRAGSIVKADGEWVLGPMFELRLPFGLAVEADALYRRYRVIGASRSSLEFPVIAKFRAPGIVVSPVIGAGANFQRLGDIPAFLENPGLRSGFVVMGGLEIKVPLIRIAPEIRYTRFREKRITDTLLTGTNQVDVLIGITF